mmetsp:Transcript_12249/g.16972  ORF Transcript_12249/g.16972 Transcript_12249/m.16972 type:complete len:491 (-) Transcript_12249:128-1600(-)
MGGRHMDTYQKPGMSVQLSYPRERRKLKFAELLESSLNTEETNRVWCEKCATYCITKKSSSLKKAPLMLTINAEIKSEADLDLWRSTSPASAPSSDKSRGKSVDDMWVAPKIRLSYDNASGRCIVSRIFENKSPEPSKSKAKADSKGSVPYDYELIGVVCHISDPPDTDSELNVYNAEHLTAHLKIKEDAKSSKGKWTLFNGFMITESSLKDAIEFSSFPWKEPCILLYQRVDVFEQIQIPQRVYPMANYGLAAFLRPERLSAREVVPMRTFAPLRSHERIGPDMKVAIDCEFVCVEKEETRLNPKTGKDVLVKPMRHSLARVSLLRASGPEVGKPLLDDYIVGSEPVVDYLTRYSGIEPGDLDRSISTRHLVTLKSAYLRLRYLADQGVTFIGHGLKSDFVMINIVVPQKQIIDTVDLYHLPNSRKLNLRFLATHVLKLDIQGVTHDSIEDARTAMLLYARYQQLKSKGIFDQVLHELYEIGNKYGFKA